MNQRIHKQTFILEIITEIALQSLQGNTLVSYIARIAFFQTRILLLVGTNVGTVVLKPTLNVSYGYDRPTFSDISEGLGEGEEYQVVDWKSETDVRFGHRKNRPH